MNSLEIDILLRRNALTRKYYIGVFPSDQLPKRTIKKNFCIVINVCPGVGCHWMGIFKRNKSIHVFDPSGLPSHRINANINNFIERQKAHNICSNKVQLQDMESDTCGHHVLVFIFMKCLGYSIKKIISYYNKKNLRKNDSVVKKLLKNFYFNNK